MNNKEQYNVLKETISLILRECWPLDIQTIYAMLFVIDSKYYQWTDRHLLVNTFFKFPFWLIVHSDTKLIFEHVFNLNAIKRWNFESQDVLNDFKLAFDLKNTITIPVIDNSYRFDLSKLQSLNSWIQLFIQEVCDEVKKITNNDIKKIKNEITKQKVYEDTKTFWILNVNDTNFKI